MGCGVAPITYSVHRGATSSCRPTASHPHHLLHLSGTFLNLAFLAACFSVPALNQSFLAIAAPSPRHRCSPLLLRLQERDGIEARGERVYGLATRSALLPPLWLLFSRSAFPLFRFAGFSSSIIR